MAGVRRGREKGSSSAKRDRGGGGRGELGTPLLPSPSNAGHAGCEGYDTHLVSFIMCNFR